MEHGGEVWRASLDRHLTGEKGREGLLQKMIGLKKQKQNAGSNPCEDSSTLNKTTDDKK